jgi:hypothetical protein
MRGLILMGILCLTTGCSALMVGFLLTPESLRVPAPTPTPSPYSR